MKNKLPLPTYGRYILAPLTALELFITGAGLSPAAASTIEPETVINNITVTTQTEAGTVGLILPGTSVAQPQVSLTEVPEEYLNVNRDATPIASTQTSHAAFSSYETDTGTQTFIQIGSAEASHDYRFPLGLPTGATAQVIGDGAVIVKDSKNKVLGGYSVPWAVDAKGNQVPTRFKIEDDTLIQTIDFTPRTTFPITADPNSWWGWTQCAAAIGLFVATNGLAAAKIAKIGGITKLIDRLRKLQSSDQVFAALVTFFGEFLGTDTIINKCR